MNPIPMARALSYRTLEGQVIRVDKLAPEEQALYQKLRAEYRRNPSHTYFNFYWQSEGSKVWGDRAAQGKDARREIADSPIFAICQDLDARLAIREGHVADYSERRS